MRYYIEDDLNKPLRECTAEDFLKRLETHQRLSGPVKDRKEFGHDDLCMVVHLL